MGAGLVRTSFGITGLSTSARLVLIVMCLHARDTPSENQPERLYDGGWELLAWEALGRWGTAPNTRATAKDRAAHQATYRAVRELLDAGLIKQERSTYDPLVQGPRRGASAYRILI